MSDYSVSSDDQLWAQNFTIIDSRGRSITFNMPELDSYQLYGQRLAINYATQFGASFVMLLALLLATRAERRNSFVFLVNVITLAFNTVRSILCACFTTSGFWSPYFQITNDGIGITKSDRATNATALVMGILVTGLVYASLSMQVWTVCAITPRPQRLIIIFITTAVSLAAMGLKIATTIAVIKANLDYRPMDPDDKLTQASPALQLVAIWLFSFIFTLKLGFAIVRRRRLNMRQFGPMQIVFIMGCQTMLVPAVFNVLQFYGPVAEFATLGLTIVCIFLPLSAMWAGTHDNPDACPGRPNTPHPLLIKDSLVTHSSATGSHGASSERSRQMSICTCLSGKDIENGLVVSKKNNTTCDRDLEFIFEDNISKAQNRF